MNLKTINLKHVVLFVLIASAFLELAMPVVSAWWGGWGWGNWWRPWWGGWGWGNWWRPWWGGWGWGNWW